MLYIVPVYFLITSVWKYGMHIDIIININRKWSVINENDILVRSIGSSGVVKSSIRHVADLVLQSWVPVENFPGLWVEPNHQYIVALLKDCSKLVSSFFYSKYFMKKMLEILFTTIA